MTRLPPDCMRLAGQEDVHAGAESLLAADSMVSRASKMFGAGASEPRGSGLPPACGKPSKLLVQIAWKAAKDLCDTHGKTGIVAEESYLRDDDGV